MIKKLLIAGGLTASLLFLNGNYGKNTDYSLYTSTPIQNYEISENKAPEYSVKFMIVTPCIKGEDCYDFNKEILDGASKYYAEYGINVEFVREYIEVESPISVDVGTHTEIMDAFALKLDLIRATGVEMPHILHAPMFVNTKPGEPGNGILGVANQYLELVVLKQQMIDTEDLDIETHVLVHEIGHIFGLPDIYNPSSCNLMDGYTSYKTIFCQKLTPEQVTFMKETIKTHLM